MKGVVVTSVSVCVVLAFVFSSCGQSETSISGRVYGALDGKPIAGAQIAVNVPYAPNGSIHTETAANGRYRVTGLDVGEAKVAAYAKGYVVRWYDSAYSYDDATKVTTTIGNNTPNVDFTLEWGGSVSGYVRLSDGTTTAAEAWVYSMQVSGAKTPRLGSCEPLPPQDMVRTAADGRYTISGLLTGEYELAVMARGANLFSNGTTVAAVVLGEETQGIDFVLVPGGSISGHVYESDGTTPVAGAHVAVHGWLGDHSTNTASGGSYSTGQLAPGDYYIKALQGGRNPPYVQVTVTSGKDTVHDIVQLK